MTLCLTHDQAEKLMQDTLAAMEFCRARKISEAEKMMRELHDTVLDSLDYSRSIEYPLVVVDVPVRDIQKFEGFVREYRRRQVERFTKK